MKNMNEVVKYMDKVNPNDFRYRYNREYFFFDEDWYKAILKEVLKLDPRPKRVVDVGSNYNVFGYLFENEGIEYIGIDNYLEKGHVPYTTDKVKFIKADYQDIKDQFADDVLVSCLCVGYQVNIEDVRAKHLIVNDLDETGKPVAKKIF